VPFSTLTLSSTSAFLHAKTLTGIAITSRDRLAEFPDLPTFKELDHPELLDNTWFAFSGPSKVPEEVVMSLNRAVIEVVALPDVQERFARDGFLAQPMNSKDFTNFVGAENTKWKAIIQQAGLAGKPQ
jgi:tripartite-type tricarboxylate transporter receptor subunit TctC